MAYYKLNLGGTEFEHGKALYNTPGIVKSVFTNKGSAKWLTQNFVQEFNDSPNIQSRSTKDGRFYGVEVDADGKMYVNVPWENTVGEDVDLSGYKTLQTPVAIVKDSSDGSISFINSISQNENGEITGDFGSINLSGYKTKQEKYNFSGIGLTFINSISQNENGEIIANGKTLDLSEYATKNDIPSLTNYPTRDEINSLIPKPISISNKSATLTPGGTTTIATIGDVDITVGMPNISSGEGEMSADGVLSNVIADEGGNGEVIFDRTILGPISANLSHNHDILEVGSDGLYVTDSNKNVVAKINKDGIDSTDLKIKGTSISNVVNNCITGSGTSGYLAVFNGKNTITNGPAFGSSTTTYLRNDGQWTGIKQSDIEWGGNSLADAVSPIGAAMSDELSANRLAFMNPNGIDISYSNDGGSTYNNANLADNEKVDLVTKLHNVNIGPEGNVTTNYRTQIVLKGVDPNTNTTYIYTRPKKLLLYVTTNSHKINVTIEYATGSDPNNWITYGTYDLDGWSGWNDIPFQISTFGGYYNQLNNYWYIRLTFAVKTASTSSSYSTVRPNISSIRLYGDTFWMPTSNYGKNGHLYDFDWKQNAVFPNNITATQFNGVISSKTITPQSHNTYNIGTDANRFINGYFEGSVYAKGGFFESSDERLKNFEDSINIDLDALVKLKKVYFHWKDNDKDLQLGVSAQEIKTLYPEIVNETETGYLSVDYAKLSVIALAAIDKLVDKQKDLEERLERLEKMIK